MRQHQERFFTSHDGHELFYRYWPAETGTPRGAVVLMHRGHEHSGRMAHLVDELDMPDFAFFAWDQRGLGRSRSSTGPALSMSVSIRDTQSFHEHLSEAHGIPPEETAVVAQSMAAVIASAWVLDYAPGLRCMALASPAFSVKLYVPFALPLIRLGRALRGEFFVNSYVKANLLSHDPERRKRFAEDPLIARPIASTALLELDEMGRRVVENAPSILTPTLLLMSGSDVVVRHEPQHRFYETLGAVDKERIFIPGAYHDTLGERNRADTVRACREFILARFHEPIVRPCVLDADRRGYSRMVQDRISRPLSPWSPQGLYWRTQRGLMRFGARFSEGLRIGVATGFDSGTSLDYVYRNTPSGTNAFGVFIDRVGYHNAIGWRGIRQRKIHMEALLRLALRRAAEDGLPVTVLDVAAGHGRYVLDALKDSAVQPESVLLRDFNGQNVKAGQQLIRERGLEGVIRFEQGDAFDKESLSALAPKRAIGIVSGLFELFPENGPVRTALEGLAQALLPGGYLLVTNQATHPQQEYIARVLQSHIEGRPWVMRCRSQEEMNQLLDVSGFVPILRRVDQWGIFSVTLARRKT
ncbi:bifunctional alpha/beta hydrolase/class I SAM-dependent methyltransferase [uncultured Bilophila sp.]|uniref:bifunctional alpha/beta hydrolase/class I SAM-dependent methyltransferase n=1 Tax=uncultured Bilophila sp. TaxID=529385 RepID=UPI0025FD3716|nr:bifunctional alpha/beta hydrolase/class I SAM-dependent methyltransferase [uncultured Bilophila sp.]